MTAFSQNNRSPFLQQNQPFPSVAVGQKCVVNIPTGQTYLNHFLFCTVAGTAATQAQMIASIASISLKLNGIQIVYITGAMAVYLVNYYRGNKNSGTGIIGTTGWLPIMFERSWMQTLPSQRGPALGTVGQNSYQIEVQLISGSSIDGLQLWNEIDVVAEALGRHVQLQYQTHTFSGTGLDTVIDLPQADVKNPADTIQAIHLVLPSGVTWANIDYITVLAEKLQIWSVLPQAMLTQIYSLPSDSRQIQAGYVPIDFMYRNRQDGQLPDSALTLQLQIHWNASPGTYALLLELLTGAPQTTTSGTLPAVATVPGGSPASYKRK